jgi:hypothetical protein
LLHFAETVLKELVSLLYTLIITFIVFNAKPEEFDQCLKRQNVMQQDTFIKLRGLPFSCKLEEIEQFFEGKIDINISR